VKQKVSEIFRTQNKKEKNTPSEACTNTNTVYLSRERPLQILQCKTFLTVFQQTKCDRFRWIFCCCFGLGVLL